MKAVIDIGTNTIRSVVYDEDMTELFNRGVISRILDYTVDGALTAEGLVWLSNVVGTLSVMAEQFAVKPKACATSAFRELENAEEVAEYIKEYTGVEVIVLSGEEEALCDLVSLRRHTDSGVGVDLGGGSCQIISFDKDSYDAKSYPIGVKRIKNRFLAGDIPNEEEIRGIYEFVNKEIGTIIKTDCVYIFGGTARALAKLNEKRNITAEELEKIKALVYAENVEDYLRKKVKDRFDTVLVGASVLSAIADAAGAKELKVVDCSVRIGFALRYCN